MVTFMLSLLGMGEMLVCGHSNGVVMISTDDLAIGR